MMTGNTKILNSMAAPKKLTVSELGVDGVY